MRLGIRRKLIGTLMLVGLFPLIMSLVVILGGGAALQLSRIRSNYEGVASRCAYELANTVQNEIEKITLLARLSKTVEFFKERSVVVGDDGAPERDANGVPLANEAIRKVDHDWPNLKLDDAVLSRVLHNELSERLRLVSTLDNHPRQIFATNVRGETIAADVKPADFFQADEEWWKNAYDKGRGRPYVSSIVINPVNNVPSIEIAVPVYEDHAARKNLLGIIKAKIEVAWLAEPLRNAPAKEGAVGQLFDLSANKTVYATGDSELTARAEKFYLEHRTETHLSIMTLFMNDLVSGWELVDLQRRLGPQYEGGDFPSWVVLVSKPSEEAMVRVYQLAATVAGIGAVLIFVLFILGVAISNREIIMPILRIREATAAVGRGELNVRLMNPDQEDPTFRRDEIGDLARDFDEMTRQLQKNVNALARSNEAKRRFMELAGHELKTPVTYILGVCNLAMKQAEAAAQAAASGKNMQAAATALGKISAKTQRLSRIIDSLLKLANNDQFTTKLNKQPVDLRQLVLDVTSDSRAFVAERKQTLEVDVAEALPAFEGDADKLEDVLTNLLSNAIRFSPDEGRIKVTLHKALGEMIELTVTDTGPGIPQQDIDELFTPFYTGSDILHHHSGEFEFGSRGIGLGLAIVRRFVELHGGVVRVNSSSKGTTFTVLLPINA